MFVDSHCHLNDAALDPELAFVNAKENGVTAILVVGWDLESSKKAVEIANKYNLYAAVGFHPENLETISDEALEQIKTLASDPKVVAIGEIGLDYHWFKEEKDHENQKKWFIKQIELANSLHLPISIHAREASEDTYELIKAHPIEKGAVLHCYSGSPEMMDRFAKLGLYFGFDGPITFKNAITPKECVKHCPKDRILSETDAPYMAPTPFRGKTNEPKYIPLIVNAMAELRGVSPDEMAATIKENFERLFGVTL